MNKLIKWIALDVVGAVAIDLIAMWYLPQYFVYQQRTEGGRS